MSTPSFAYSHSISRRELPASVIWNPVDFALGANDVVYVVHGSSRDAGTPLHGMVTVCTLNNTYIRAFGSYGEKDGQFIWPTSIALDQNENVYVADQLLNRISVF